MKYGTASDQLKGLADCGVSRFHYNDIAPCMHCVMHSSGYCFSKSTVWADQRAEFDKGVVLTLATKSCKNFTICTNIRLVSAIAWNVNILATSGKLLDIAESWTMAVKGKKLCNISIALWQHLVSHWLPVGILVTGCCKNVANCSCAARWWLVLIWEWSKVVVFFLPVGVCGGQTSLHTCMEMNNSQSIVQWLS